MYYEDAACNQPCGQEPAGCPACKAEHPDLEDMADSYFVEDYFETHYISDIDEWEEEQVFQDMMAEREDF